MFCSEKPQLPGEYIFYSFSWSLKLTDAKQAAQFALLDKMLSICSEKQKTLS